MLEYLWRNRLGKEHAYYLNFYEIGGHFNHRPSCVSHECKHYYCVNCGTYQAWNTMLASVPMTQNPKGDAKKRHYLSCCGQTSSKRGSTQNKKRSKQSLLLSPKNNLKSRRYQYNFLECHTQALFKKLTCLVIPVEQSNNRNMSAYAILEYHK